MSAFSRCFKSASFSSTRAFAGLSSSAAIVPAGLKHGVVVNRTAENVIRLLPPLVITEAELDEGLARLDLALAEITGKGDSA